MSFFPHFKQLDAMDCGPASLKIVSKFYGKTFSMKFLRDKCNITKEGVSLKDICTAAEEIGLRTLPLKSSYDDLLLKIPLPCIIHWNYTHFVVVYKIKKNKVYISDPQIGLVKYDRNKFEFLWKKNNEKGTVLVIEPTSTFKDIIEVKSQGSFRTFTKYVKPHKRYLLQVFLGMLISVLISLVFPFITQSIVDIGIETRDFNFINILLVSSIVLTLSSAISSYVQSRLMLYVSDKVNIGMVSDFIRKVFKLPITFFEKKMVSDILNRINDHSRIQSFVIDSFLGIVVSGLSFIVFSVVLLLYSFNLFITFIIGALFAILWVLIFLKRRRRLDFQYFDSSVYNQNEIIQLVDNNNDIKINNLELKKRWDWERSRYEIYNLNVKILNITQLQKIGSSILDRLKNVVITYLAAKAVINGDITIGMMLSAQYIIGQMNAPINNLIKFIHSYQEAKISLERVSEVRYEEEVEVISEGVEVEMPSDKTITIDNLSFSYSKNGPSILENISLVIPEGKMTAIVGESGSGKTTLLKVLLRLYQQYNGKIEVGNVNLKSINLHEWRDKSGAVLQEGKIFNDTILHNIVLDEENIDFDKLSEVIVQTNLKDFINNKPLKLYTIIGQGGEGLSVGQKQRILIARAMYKAPDFLFLDEATNSLDTKNEKEISNYINNVSQGKTTIVVAHRLSTIKNADQIIVLSKGKVIEVGNHLSLLEKKCAYYNLVKNQIDLEC